MWAPRACMCIGATGIRAAVGTAASSEACGASTALFADVPLSRRWLPLVAANSRNRGRAAPQRLIPAHMTLHQSGSGSAALKAIAVDSSARTDTRQQAMSAHRT